jgi:hypothetical protein
LTAAQLDDQFGIGVLLALIALGISTRSLLRLRVVDQISDAVERMTTIASDAQQEAMEPDPVTPNEQSDASTTMRGDGMLTGPVTPTSKKAPKKPAKGMGRKHGKEIVDKEENRRSDEAHG